MSSRATTATAALVLLAGLTGCGQVGEADVTAVAATFYDAYESGHMAAACDELAPRTRSELEQSAGKPCAQALADEDVPTVGRPVRVRVFGTAAKVDYTGETTFLARFQGGWKVMAAACTPQPDKPYDCSISGG